MTSTPANRTAGADFSAENNTLRLYGDWTLAHYSSQEAEVQSLKPHIDAATVIDADALAAVDTAGASLLYRLLGKDRIATLATSDSPLPIERRALIQAVSDALIEMPAPAAQQHPRRPLTDSLALLGSSMERSWKHLIGLLGFSGLVLESMARITLHPSRWRVTAWVASVDQTTLRAVPIVTLMNFMVGAVVAFLGATVLKSFGASIFTVDLVAVAFLREFGVLLAAILVAGRTASAFAAQIGSMRSNEEIDALRVQGMNPIEMLVIPRVQALFLGLPILTFVAIIAGISGGMSVCALMLDISPRQFLAIVQSDDLVMHFYKGMAKAPVMAFAIAIIGCCEGFKVEGSAQSVGEHTTSAVVQSIFTVILIDALAALLYMKMDW